MAYINATLWNDFQSGNASNDKRFSQLGVVDLVADSTEYVDYILPSDKRKMSELSSLRLAKIPVIKDQTVTVLTTPGFNFIPANLPETDNYSFVAYDVFSGFRHYPAAYDNNQVDSDYAREQVMRNVAYEMGKTVEGILITNLEARKSQQLGFTTQVSQGDGTFSFSTGTDTLTVSKAAQKDGMYFYLEALMEANELGGNYRLVTNRAGTATARAEWFKYGKDNSKDLQALTVLPMDRIYESGSLIAGSDVFTGFLVRDGAIGMIENFPYDFRNGTEIGGKKWSITDMDLPYCRMRANIYVNKDATEATSLITSGVDSNLVMTHFEEMGIWLRFYVVYRYNGDLANRANDIVKIVGSAA